MTKKWNLFIKFLKKGYLSHKSGMWYKNQIFSECPDAKINDDLVIWFYKKSHLTNTHKFPMINVRL